MVFIGGLITGGHKYVVLRDTGHSEGAKITVFQVTESMENATLTRLSPDDDAWPGLFFGFASCHCNLNSTDISDEIKTALGILGKNIFISGHHHTVGGMGGHHVMDSDMSSYSAGFSRGNNIAMHGQHSMESMYNHMGDDAMGSDMSSYSAGFSRGNNIAMHGHDAVGFADMA